MRFVSAFLLVALTGSVVLADDTKAAEPKAEVTRKKVPFRVVKMLPETHQVLLFDRTRGTHVVAETGQDVGGYLVEDIDDDEVTLVTQNGAEVILTAPEASWRARRDRKAADTGSAPDASATSASPSAEMSAVPTTSAPAPVAGPAPVDPYGEGDASAQAPIVAGEGGVRVASASDQPSAAPVTSASAPVTSLPAPVSSAPVTASPAPVAAAPAPSPDAAFQAFADAVGSDATPAEPVPVRSAKAPATRAPATKTAGKAAVKATKPTSVDAAADLAAAATGSPAVPPANTAPAVGDTGASSPATASFSVARHDVDAALSDFGATAVTFDAAFTGEGLHFDHIAKGTVLAKLGLQAGDTLVAVDNQPLRSLDDAATLYARAGSARAAQLHVLRAGKPVTLAVTIR